MRKIVFMLPMLLACLVLSSGTTAFAQFRISVTFGPPALPVYEQPICPGDGYMWTPGYWAWNDDDGDYYWVPGTWVMSPQVGYLWTPPWWGWSNGVYLFHEGYWGPHVGFYGGVAYGFGYGGYGFEGGRWDHDHYYYNRSVTNVNVTNVTNVYNTTVINNNTTINRVSYNGGPGGLQAQARPEDERAEHEQHLAPVAAQTQHIQEARANRDLRASVNQGRPSIAATPRPSDFHSREAVGAREAGAPYHPPTNRGGTPGASEGSSRPTVHPNDLPKFRPFTPPSTGNANRDQKYQQQQDKLLARQGQQRQNLQQKQEQEHQQLDRQNAPQAQRDQMEQRHQQQTEQLQQKHTQEQQRMQERQQPAHR